MRAGHRSLGADDVPTWRSTRPQVVRTLAAATIGAAVGVIQWSVLTSGMRDVAGRPGLTGIGTAAEYAVAIAAASLLLFALTSALLRRRRWISAAFTSGLLELLLAVLLWPLPRRLGLAGNSAALLCIPLAAVVAAAVERWWPRRD